jgi:enoyl-CoA hydratase/carnithine racemase
VTGVHMSNQAASRPVIRPEDRDGVATLILSRPGRHNAWGADMRALVQSELAQIEADDSVRAIVLTGEGKSFSSGADVGVADAHQVSSIGEEIASGDSAGGAFKTLLAMSKPVVCGVEGYAIGAGFLLTLCCDIVVAAKSAKFALPQVGFGILPTYGGIGRLAQYVGRGRALEIALTGRRVSAEEAASIGIVGRLCEDGEAQATAFEVAKLLASLPPLAVQLARESVHDMFEGEQLSATVTADVYRLLCLKSTVDNVEAHNAWREKRPGKFLRR